MATACGLSISELNTMCVSSFVYPVQVFDFAMAASVSPQLLSEEEEEEEEEEEDSSAAQGLVLLFSIPMLSCTLAWFVHV